MSTRAHTHLNIYIRKGRNAWNRGATWVGPNPNLHCPTRKKFETQVGVGLVWVWARKIKLNPEMRIPDLTWPKLHLGTKLTVGAGLGLVTFRIHLGHVRVHAYRQFRSGLDSGSIRTQPGPPRPSCTPCMEGKESKTCKQSICRGCQ